MAQIRLDAGDVHGLDVGSGVWLRMGLGDSRWGGARVGVGEGGRSVAGTFVVGAGRPVHLLRL